MSTFLFDDVIGAAVSFVALLLGWLALAAIVATGFIVSGLYVARRAIEVLELAKRDFRRTLGHKKKPLEKVAVKPATTQTGLMKLLEPQGRA